MAKYTCLMFSWMERLHFARCFSRTPNTYFINNISTVRIHLTHEPAPQQGMLCCSLPMPPLVVCRTVPMPPLAVCRALPCHRWLYAGHYQCHCWLYAEHHQCHRWLCAGHNQCHRWLCAGSTNAIAGYVQGVPMPPLPCELQTRIQRGGFNLRLCCFSN